MSIPVAPQPISNSRSLVLYAWSGLMVGGSLLLVLVPSATFLSIGCFFAAAALVQVSGVGKNSPPVQRAAAFLGVPFFAVIGIWQVIQGSASPAPRWLSLPCLGLALVAVLVFWRRPHLLTAQSRAA